MEICLGSVPLGVLFPEAEQHVHVAASGSGLGGPGIHNQCQVMTAIPGAMPEGSLSGIPPSSGRILLYVFQISGDCY